jgi:hypothetical protein
MLSVAALCATMFGCGGGGGGAPPADVAGRILLTTTGQPPNPAATVTIAGRSVQTLNDGTFILRGVGSDARQIQVSAQGLLPLTQPLPTLTANQVNNLGDIFLSGIGYTAVAKGRVVRADTLAELAGARVRISGQVTTTAADGTFTLSGLPVGLGGMMEVGLITAANFEDKPVRIDPPLGASPPDNDLGDILVAPPVGGIPGGPTTIRGTVSLQGRTNFAGTTVTLLNKSNGQTLGTQVTAADGRYGFWVPVGQYQVKAEHPGPPAFQSQTKDVTLSRTDQPQTVNFTLIP